MSVAARPGQIVQAIMGRVLPGVCIQDVRAMPSQRHQKLYGVQSSDGSQFLITFSTSRIARSLRSEQGSISSEAAVLSWLAALSVDKASTHETDPTAEVTEAAGPSQCSEGCMSTDTSNEVPSQLAIFIPILVAHLPLPNEMGVAYNVMKPTSGSLIAGIHPGLSSGERRAVDIQIGQLYRKLCRLVSPTGRFGPVSELLPSPTVPLAEQPIPSARCAVHGTSIKPGGISSWPTAFHSMLEAVLRDGEDMAIMLGYTTIRRHFKRLKPALDGVVSPRLVAIDIGSDINMLVVREEQPPEAVPVPPRQSPDREAGGHKCTQSDGDDVKENDGQCSRRVSDGGEDARFGTQGCVTVRGMKDWSNFIFGDPLFAAAFSQDPSEEFLEGFRGVSDNAKASDPTLATVSLPSLVEDEPNAPIRLLFYECYHTVTQIVSEFYRPQWDSSQRELAARKKLNNVLGRLAEVGDVGVPLTTDSK
ncbi:hypothetical protein SODALDRAFT_21536 [Sodiomyces alkalinus F11]|uniref:Aminoglycoside phosphotransferase domain-containing protein n=1 Tax=Sodiomyces alkalinus (strain CBS 110278 / VKM F-3762 / F11) TaxID=1314773 RepID=A0A3N2Q7Q0_SODAK|nr:hypothetical protein SODALDRAFT_21536 [Sodiomyces alkalinus F11]ROT42707.1 hypothetical protein SODALDRAFT_21536 [Sodiomyces alkalinus F11]